MWTGFTLSHFRSIFPRLGMWLTKAWERPITEITRYDWLILGDWYRQFIQPLRDLNPISFCSIPPSAVILASIPNPAPSLGTMKRGGRYRHSGFLQQVGSVLTAAVNATETQFRVAAVTSAAGSTVIGPVCAARSRADRG